MNDSSKHISLLGGKIEIILYDIDRTIAESYFGSIQEEGIRLQKIFNFFDPTSELSLLNKKREIKASPELLEVVKKAIDYSKKTEGAYDVTKGKQFLARKQKKPLPPVSCSYKHIHVNKNSISLKHPDALIDLGSIAKGYIVDKLTSFIQALGIESSFIDARGDMKVHGNHLEVIEIQHPRNKKASMGTIVLENNAVATSGDYRQYDTTFDKCHIIGKREFVSVTVVADSCMEADAAATTFFVLESDKRQIFLKNNPELKVMAIDKDIHTHYYNNFEQLVKQ